MQIVSKLSDFIFSIEKILACILVSMMSLTLILSVIYRYFFNSPLHWSDEVAIYSMIWATFIGGSMGIKRRQASAVTFLVERVGLTTRKVLVPLGFFVGLAFCLLVVVLSYQWIGGQDMFAQRSLAMQMPMFFPYLSVPVGFTFMTVHCLDLFLKSLSSSHHLEVG